MLPRLTEAFRALPGYRGLQRELPERGHELGLRSLPGSSAAVLLATLAQDFPQRVFLIVAATPTEAERWLADLDVLVAGATRLYPQRESLGEEEPHLEIAGERVETIAAALAGQVQVVVTTLRATAELTRMPRAVTGLRLDIEVGRPARLSDVVERLEAMGYERRPSVLDVAQFAVRGGIIDVYGFGMAAPTRIEWWGDEPVSIRAFDLDSQRSEDEITRVTVLPIAPGGWGGGEGEREGGRVSLPASHADRQSLLDLLPPDTMVFVDEGVDAADVHRTWAEAPHHIEVAQRRGEDVPGREALFLDPVVWKARWERFGRVVMGREAAEHDLKLLPPPPVERDIRQLVGVIRGQLERLEELLGEAAGRPAAVPRNAVLALGSLGGGFAMRELMVLTDHEIFRRARRIRRPRRYRQALTPAGSLTPGDFVVHLEHGIGIYRGIGTITVGEGATMEVAVLEYEGGDRLNVPLYRLDQVEPYRAIGDGDKGTLPRIDRLGGTRWRKRRERTEAAIRKMAAELLELYARRSLAGGFAYPPDTRWQRELESSFLYEDTPDQRTAAEETKRDLERPHPMDRLIVGDVGYGKTEVAVRAAFKAVQADRQVVMLVPTTILAEQHGRTFRDRLADYPVEVEVLSRFRTPAEQKEVLQRLKQGKVDIAIGTHRLLSSDVGFRELGLMIVDEEHRFGVRHKERLKALKLEVDVLTLTATPIPRTLHLALSGLRDLTLIQTPPRDRSPVLTFIEPWDDELLEGAIARELDRAGQVFFVHNRIETIDTVAQRVEKLAPRGTVAVAHGKMRERELDRVMRRFVAGEIDVLVSTMIVESGLDVPNANTMIVHQAHQLGLAQLYQLRGRVGRGHRRAYCLLLVPDSVDPEAEQRLKVLEHHTELGSGYRIALRDLQLRGAGNILGGEQSGHAHAVGFDLYMRWLDETVRALKGEADHTEYRPPDVLFEGPAHLPDVYVPDDDAKLGFYRRLARAGGLGEIAALREELRDRFGPLPDPADRLLVVSELRALGAQMGLETVVVRGDDARLKFRRGAHPKLMRLTAALEKVQFAAEVRQTVPLSMRLHRLGGVSIGAGLVRALAAVVGEDGEGRG
jgi:transcription-repair coupling factor (superfamily II helicase)